MFVVKECTKCKEYKLLEEFFMRKKSTFGFCERCKLCIKEYYQANKERIKKAQKEYYQANKERRNEYGKEYYQANKERVKKYKNEQYQANKELIKKAQKEYYQANKERIIESKKEYQKVWRRVNKERLKEYRRHYDNNRISTDRMFKIKHNIRNLISNSIRRKGYSKKSRVHEILGCDHETFKLHIKRQFKKGMSWENYGEWHLDHIYPVSLAKDEQHLIELNHYTNFQPLWAKDNLSKSNNIIEPIQIRLTI